MRKEFTQVKTRKEAVKEMPWAAIIIKVNGGYMGFESKSDYETWKSQK